MHRHLLAFVALLIVIGGATWLLIPLDRTESGARGQAVAIADCPVAEHARRRGAWIAWWSTTIDLLQKDAEGSPGPRRLILDRLQAGADVMELFRSTSGALSRELARGSIPQAQPMAESLVKGLRNGFRWESFCDSNADALVLPLVDVLTLAATRPVDLDDDVASVALAFCETTL